MAKDPTLYNELLSGNYFNGLIFHYGGNVYVGDTGQNQIRTVQTETPPTWILHKSNFGPFTGYWIYNADGNKCWQAQNDTGNLVYWNWDGKAKPLTPQDYEIFYIRRPVDPAFIDDNKGNWVSIKHVHGGDHANWVAYANPGFHAGAPISQAAVFDVEFDATASF